MAKVKTREPLTVFVTTGVSLSTDSRCWNWRSFDRNQLEDITKGYTLPADDTMVELGSKRWRDVMLQDAGPDYFQFWRTVRHREEREMRGLLAEYFQKVNIDPSHDLENWKRAASDVVKNHFDDSALNDVRRLPAEIATLKQMIGTHLVPGDTLQLIGGMTNRHEVFILWALLEQLFKDYSIVDPLYDVMFGPDQLTDPTTMARAAEGLSKLGKVLRENYPALYVLTGGYKAHLIAAAGVIAAKAYGEGLSNPGDTGADLAKVFYLHEYDTEHVVWFNVNDLRNLAFPANPNIHTGDGT